MTKKTEIDLSRQSAKIWVVEDDPALCRNLNALLSRGGYKVKAFTHPQKAVKALAGEDFDVMLTDLMMPEMNGLELLVQVKERHPDREVILLTANASVASAVEAINKGAFSYLLKPFKTDELLRVIRQALDKRRLTLENRRLLEELSQANQELAQKAQELTRALADLKLAQDSLVENERLAAIGELVVSINHQINNPLTAILGMLELIAKEPLAPPALELCAGLKAEVKRIQKVTAQLRDLKTAEQEEYIPGIKMIKLE